VFLWPSIVYQPLHLIRALIGAKPWRAAPALAAGERAFVPIDSLIRSKPARETVSASDREAVAMALPILSQPQD
jgi:hypothetical protein